MRLHTQEQANIEGHLSQWLFTVCRNCALKSLKKEDRYIYVEHEEFEHRRVDSITPLQEMARRETVTRLSSCRVDRPRSASSAGCSPVACIAFPVGLQANLGARSEARPGALTCREERVGERPGAAR